MTSKLRRFEVLLPIRYNDGSDIPEVLLAEAVNEVVQEFCFVSFRRDAVEGQWRHEAVLYRDNLACIIVDLPDNRKNREWMRAFKARWKERLQQFEIWMVSYRVDVD